jgi:hypothetical protein
MEDNIGHTDSGITGRVRERGNQQSALIARQQNSDEVNDNDNARNVTTPDRDSTAENKMATSFDDE